MLSAHAHNLAEYVGKGCQQVHTNYYSTIALISVQIDSLQDADAVHGVCSRALDLYIIYRYAISEVKVIIT